jgi:hypothetical protein
MNTPFYLKKFIRQVILESTGSPDASELAVYLPLFNSNKVKAVIYDTNVLLQNLEKLKTDHSNSIQQSFAIKNMFINYIIKGFLEAGKPSEDDGPCNGAWQIYRAVGPGYGKILYGVGYALSPNGQLFPDRGSVSADAQSAWKKVFGGSRGRKRFDDVKHQHSNPENKYHTDDPGDDCKIYRAANGEYLNYSYESEGWEHGVLSQLQANHKETMSKIRKIAPDLDNIEDFLNDAKYDFFLKHYKSEGSLEQYI